MERMPLSEISLDFFIKQKTDEYDLLGKRRLTSISDAVENDKEIKIIENDRGSNFGVSESIQLAVAIIVGIKTILDLFTYYKGFKEKVRKEELLKELLRKNKSENQDSRKLAEDELNELLDYLYDKYFSQ